MGNDFSWDLDKGGGTGGSGDKAEFVKFPEGITRIRVIDQAPYQRWIHFIQKHKRSINCPGKGCPICEIRKNERANGIKQSSHNMAKRFALNVINRETGRVEILEQGKTFMQDMIDLRADLSGEGKDIQDADIKVRRRGTTKDDTSYRLDIDKVYPLSADDEKEKAKAINLAEYFKPHTPDQILRILSGEDWAEVMKGEQTGNETENADTDKHVDLPEDESIELA